MGQLELSIGLVNVMLKAIVLIVFPIAIKSKSMCLKLMASFRLRNMGQIPVIFENDGQIFNVWSTVRRLARPSNSGIFFVVVLSLLMIPAEIVSDFGVDVSGKCRPLRFRTDGICGYTASNFRSWSKAISTALVVEDVSWNNEHLSKYPIRQGFRKQINGMEYFGTRLKPNNSLPIIICNCRTSNLTAFPMTDTRLIIGRGSQRRPEIVGWNQVSVRGGAKIYKGLGALVYNFEKSSAFMVGDPYETPSKSVMTRIFEYSNSADITELLESAKNVSVASVRPKSVVVMYNVSCEKATMMPLQFKRGLYAYRYAQLSRSGNRDPIPCVNVSTNLGNVPMSRPMRPSDIVRSVIASKITKHPICEGETFVFTRHCGTYKMEMAMPLFFITCLLLVVCTVYFMLEIIGGDFVKAPVTTSEWGKFALNARNVRRKYIGQGSLECIRTDGFFRRKRVYAEYVRDESSAEMFFVQNLIFDENEKEFEHAENS